jgi:hypothetical protein
MKQTYENEGEAIQDMENMDQKEECIGKKGMNIQK